jgi:vacuolar-type H+-ATPase subunit I/STV1
MLWTAIFRNGDVKSMGFGSAILELQEKIQGQINDDKNIILNIDSIVASSDLPKEVKDALRKQKQELLDLQREKQELIDKINWLGKNPTKDELSDLENDLDNYFRTSETKRNNILAQIDEAKKKITSGSGNTIVLSQKDYEKLVADKNSNSSIKTYEDEYKELLNITFQQDSLLKEKDKRERELKQALNDTTEKGKFLADSLLEQQRQADLKISELKKRESALIKDNKQLSGMIQPLNYDFEFLTKYKYNKKAEKYEVKNFDNLKFKVTLSSRNNDEREHNYSKDSLYVHVTSNRQFDKEIRQKISIKLNGSNEVSVPNSGKLEPAVYTVTFWYKRCIDESSNLFGVPQELQSFTVEILD